MKVREAVEKQAQSEDDRAALDDFEIQIAFDAALFDAPCKRERDRDADDEEKEWKDEIGRRPAIPLGVFQWPVDAGPRAGIIYQHHCGDSDAAKDVERDQTPSRVCGEKFGGHGG